MQKKRRAKHINGELGAFQGGQSHLVHPSYATDAYNLILKILQIRRGEVTIAKIKLFSN